MPCVAALAFLIALIPLPGSGLNCDNEVMATVPEAVDVSYRLDTDSTGDPSIFFALFWQTGQQWKTDFRK